MKIEESTTFAIDFGVSSRGESLEIDFPRHADFGHEIGIRKEGSQPPSGGCSIDEGGGVGQKHAVYKLVVVLDGCE